MKEHIYKTFILKRNGCHETPWNIYNQHGVWVGFGYTLKGCKSEIDDGCFDDDIDRPW